MSKEEILEKISEIFADAFDREDLEITYDTEACDIEGWDSLMHINLIEMMEDEFSIRFEMEEVLEVKNVGAFVELIEKKR